MAEIIWSEIEKMARTNLASLVFDSEFNFDRQVLQVAQQVYRDRPCRVIMIAGPSASGKTTFTGLLAQRLEYRGVKVHKISTDDFFIDRDKVPYLTNGLKDFDSLQALDLPLIQGVIDDIMQGNDTKIPHYDFKEGHSIAGAETLRIQDEDVVLIEGIHSLNPELLGGYDIMSDEIAGVFIAPQRDFVMPSGAVLTPSELRLMRRLIRDYYTRGHSLETNLTQWQEVLKAEQKFIYPFVPLADYTIDSSYDYELFLYKKCFGKQLIECALPSLANLKQVLSEVADVPMVQIPQTSLLKEFAIYGE